MKEIQASSLSHSRSITMDPVVLAAGFQIKGLHSSHLLAFIHGHDAAWLQGHHLYPVHMSNAPNSLAISNSHTALWGVPTLSITSLPPGTQSPNTISASNDANHTWRHTSSIKSFMVSAMGVLSFSLIFHCIWFMPHFSPILSFSIMS